MGDVQPAGQLSPVVEVVTIGDELLLGDTVDGNAAWLGRTLAAAGIRVVRRASVGDDEEDIRAAVREALDRSGAVVCTGGLGPTSDDLTLEAVASLFERELRLDQAVLARIRARFEERGASMPLSNERQARVPEGARVFTNARGTAPGIALADEGGRLVVLLPGVPGEMRAMVKESVLPFLDNRWSERRGVIRSRVLRTTGIAESKLADLLDGVEDGLRPVRLAYLPAVTGVDLRLTVRGELDGAEADAALERGARVVLERAGSWVYGEGDVDLVEVVAARLLECGGTLAVAESCTGGLLCERLTRLPGASRFFNGGCVPYADRAKTDLLGVRPRTLASGGAVSEEVALELARGARESMRASYALSITGVAGPEGGTMAKPVGTVWIGLAGPDGELARRFHLPGGRAEVRSRSAQAALHLLLRELGGSWR